MRSVLAATALLGALTALPALAAGPVPTRPGTCVYTSIKAIGTRLEGVPDSGSALLYANGIAGVSYDTLSEITQARAGDRIELCLVSLPQDCPPGDERGRIYAATDMRTQRFWELPDSQHSCGGA